MILLPQLSAIRLDGKDAGEFLHNQVSADVLALKDGETTFACYCEPKGRVLALMLIGKSDEAYHVVMDTSLAAGIAARLKIYVMRSNVGVEVLEDSQIVGLDGTELADTVDATTTLPVPGDVRQLAIMPAGNPVCPDQQLAGEWKTLDLIRGICWLEQATSAQFLPQMLGYGDIGAINFRKGCYPGQEIVARTHYLGKLKRFPRLIRTDTPVGAGLLDKVILHSGEEQFEAVVADAAGSKDGGFYLFTVARMDPALEVDRIEFDGETNQPEPMDQADC